MLNSISIMGRITKELELKTTQPNGHAVVSFSIATDRNYKENGEYPTDFFDIVAWRKTAEFICKYFGKGQLIAIDGKLQTRTFTDKNNNNRSAVEIVVDNAHFCQKKAETQQSNGAYAVQNYSHYTQTPPIPPQYVTKPPYTPVPNMVSPDGEFNCAPPDDFYPNFD